jgi:tetratricopeptide (TPR) repeat protein
MNSPCRLALILCAFLACTPISVSAQSPVQEESAELSAARVRAALAREREAIARNPKDPKGYIDLAYTLTDAGIGDQAQQQALKAVQLAPSSPFAQSARGWVLHHNLIGVDYGLGFDYDATLASLGKAVELDPNDLSNQQSLAELLEHNRNGIRYAPDAHLDRTIEIYNFIRSRPNGTTKEIDNNYVIILFHAGRLKEALTEISRVPRTPMLNGIAIAALAVTRGIPEALTFANQIGGDEQNKKEAIKFAAEGLWNMRLYPQAAEVLTAALPDPEEGPQLVGKIQLFHTLKPYQPANLPATDPRAPVQRLIAAEILDELTDDIIEQTVSSHTLLGLTERKQAFASVAAMHGKMQTLSRQAGLPQVVVRDIVFGSIRIAVMPSQAAGARILVQVPGSKPQGFFVIQEDGVYKIAASSSSTREVGAEALYLLRHDRAAEAESLLDWKRTFIQRDQSEDEYGGVLFSRLWLIGATKEPIDIELAAASLITDKHAAHAPP